MAAEADRLRGLEGERDRRLAEDAARLAEVAELAATLSDLRREAAGRLAAAVSAALGELGFARTGFEVELGPPSGRAGRAGGRGRRRCAGVRRERDRRGRLPLRPEPGGAGPAAREDRLGGRAEPGRPRDQGGPGGGRRDPDSRVRRDRQRDRRPERRSGRAEPVDARPRPPGPVRHPPAADRRPRRRPLPDREAGARRTDGDRGPAPRR